MRVTILGCGAIGGWLAACCRAALVRVPGRHRGRGSVIRHAVLAIALLAGCRSVDAQPSFEPNTQALEACRDSPAGTAPTGTAICAREATDAADRRIAALVSEARSPDPALRAADLSAAQMHWQRYRDLHCGLFDRRDGSSGSQTPADVELCRLGHTLRREAELRELIYLMGPR
jgi:uncharacterized protein YecT (DUF1311 family)